MARVADLQLLDSPVALIDGQGLQALTSDALSAPSLLSTSWQVVLDQPLARSAEQILARLESRAEVARHGLAPRAPAAGSADTTSEPTRHEYAGAGCCLFTSGSTGVPKGVLIGGDDLIQRACVEVSWLYAASSPDAHVAVNGYPLSEAWDKVTGPAVFKIGAAEFELIWNDREHTRDLDMRVRRARETDACLGEPSAHLPGGGARLPSLLEPVEEPTRGAGLARATGFLLLAAISYLAWLVLLDHV